MMHYRHIINTGSDLPWAYLLKFSFEVCIEADGDGFHAWCPALKGVHVGGVTEEDAQRHLHDAVMAYVISLIKHGEPIPIG